MIPVTDQQFLMDENLDKNLEIHRNAVINKNFDCWFLTDGDEGYGKSVLTGQVLKRLDPTFNIDRVVWDSKSFINLALTLPKGSAIMWDECEDGTSSIRATSKNNYNIYRLAQRIRSRNLFIGLIRPSIFDLQKPLAIRRTWFLLKVKLVGELERGYFDYYSKPNKKLLWIKGHKESNYDVYPPDFQGRFPEWYVFDRKEYEKRKDAAMDAMFDEVESEPEQRSKVQDIYYNMMVNFPAFSRLPQKRVAELFEVNRTTITNWNKTKFNTKNGGVSNEDQL